MKRDIKNIVRDLEDKKNTDIIYKKNQLKKIFNEDPDLLEILGIKDPKPLNKYKDKEHPTEEELKIRQEILAYNEKIKHTQIVDYLKLNGIQKEVLNFIMFDIRDDKLARYNDSIKTQQLIVMCLVHEDDMETEYGINRADLLDYIVKDLLCWSNSLGMQIIPENDFPDIIDSKYYCRTIKFKIEAPNSIQGGGNKYDRFHI